MDGGRIRIKWFFAFISTQQMTELLYYLLLSTLINQKGPSYRIPRGGIEKSFMKRKVPDFVSLIELINESSEFPRFSRRTRE